MSADRIKLLAGYSNPVYESDLSGLDMISLFEEMVQRLPDEPALVDGENALTYAEVNQKCNQIGPAGLAQYPAPG